MRQKTILDAMARGNHSLRVIDQARSALARFEDSPEERQSKPAASVCTPAAQEARGGG